MPQLLRSVPGLGEISAVQTLAQLPLLPADQRCAQPRLQATGRNAVLLQAGGS
jgi:hypothetical protein